MNLTKKKFELFLFTTNPKIAKECLDAGVDGIIIDWENKEKDSRQDGYSTQINYDSVEDLANIRNATDKKILCRINKFNLAYSIPEIEDAIKFGADEIFLPMIENPQDVQNALDIVNGRCQVAILIETKNAVRNAESFKNLPLSRIYIGLNDLHISSGSSNLFEPLTNNTIPFIKEIFPDIPVGVGGITHPTKGSPIPCNILIQQYVNLKMEFSFLRRSFLKDMNKYETKKLLQDIRNEIEQADSSPEKSVEVMNEEIKKYFTFHHDKNLAPTL